MSFVLVKLESESVNQMKILVVLDDYFNKTNGMCMSTQRFVHEFKKQGQQVRILSTSQGGQADYSVPELIIPFFRKIIAKEGFHIAVPKIKTIKKAVNWADIVLIETPFPLSWRSAHQAKELDKPVIGTFHIYPGNITESLHINNAFFNNFFMYFFRNISFKNCTAIQCPTAKVKKMLEKYKFKPLLYVNTNGITEDFINNPRKNHIGLPFTILCIGRYSREKHQEVLFKAMQLIEEKHNIRLIFAGQGPLRNKYEKLAQNLPQKPIMKLYSPKDLRKIMSQADLVVHCADVEIEGMACMEAFATGCVPIIADSSLSSTVDYALTKHNRFPAGNSKKLAQEIEYWYQHPAELKEMSHKYRIYAKKLTVHRSAIRYLKMMKELVQKKNESR